MDVLVSGASGLVGSALTAFLAREGHGVRTLVRREPTDAAEVGWDPHRGVRGNPGAVDAVVHLAGENIAGRRWSVAQKTRIRDSRVIGTRRLAQSLAALPQRPATFVCASAIGYYGERGDELVNEESGAGEGFLPEVCAEWEEASGPLVDAGVRVVIVRIGVVLSPAGGALAKMLPPFRMGVAGRIGSGRQYMSWITLDDVVGVLHHALVSQDLVGPVNAVAPRAATNREFTRALGRVLRRPAVMPLPAFAARMVFGEMADALLLASTRVEPRRLLERNFEFEHASLEDGLRHLLGRAPASKDA